jgi:hypothetical protein
MVALALSNSNKELILPVQMGKLLIFSKQINSLGPLGYCSFTSSFTNCLLLGL